ncbi:MAG: type II methionyl aminopeptidase [Desulfurococcaceae archaeon]
MDEESISKLLKAGRIAKEAREYATRSAKPGVKILTLAEMIENYIRELGGEPAFPVNIGINSIAAHYTPVYNDESVIPDGSIVKIDIGVHIDGYIADTAATVFFNPAYEGLVEAARSALERAIELMKPGVKASEIGEVIERTIRSAGYKPVKNLSGHSISRYTIHSGVTIPNYHDVLARHRLNPGVYAVEPFATNGVGMVKEAKLVTIYALKTRAREPPLELKRVYEYIYTSRRELPFAVRWYARSDMELEQLKKSLEQLKKLGYLHEYPVLVEKADGLVSQFEHTVVILKNEVIVATA